MPTRGLGLNLLPLRLSSTAFSEDLQIPEITLCDTAFVLAQRHWAAGVCCNFRQGLDREVNWETKAQCSGGLVKEGALRLC